MFKKLSPEQVTCLIALRAMDEPVTVINCAKRFGVCERTIYYYLASWRRAVMILTSVPPDMPIVES